MGYGYNSYTGAIQDMGIGIELHMGIGWHGPFDTKQDAINFYVANKDANPGWKAPAGFPGTVKNAVGSALNKVGITDPLGNLNLGGWILRIGEMLLGLILIGVGLAKITGYENAIAKVVNVGTSAATKGLVK